MLQLDSHHTTSTQRKAWSSCSSEDSHHTTSTQRKAWSSHSSWTLTTLPLHKERHGRHAPAGLPPHYLYIKKGMVIMLQLDSHHTTSTQRKAWSTCPSWTFTTLPLHKGRLGQITPAGLSQHYLYTKKDMFIMLQLDSHHTTSTQRKAWSSRSSWTPTTLPLHKERHGRLTPAGLPPHYLYIKKGMVIMLQLDSHNTTSTQRKAWSSCSSWTPTTLPLHKERLGRLTPAGLSQHYLYTKKGMVIMLQLDSHHTTSI